MTITRRGLADEIDLIDDKIAVLQGSKAGIYKSYREQLDDAGKTKADIAAEIVACKAAIRRRQAIAKDQNAIEAKEELSDKIFIEISKPEQSGTRNALTRVTHEADEEPPAEPESEPPNGVEVEITVGDLSGVMNLSTLGVVAQACETEIGRKVLRDVLDAVKEPAPEYDLADIPKGLDRRVSP